MDVISIPSTGYLVQDIQVGLPICPVEGFFCNLALFIVRPFPAVIPTVLVAAGLAIYAKESQFPYHAPFIIGHPLAEASEFAFKTGLSCHVVIAPLRTVALLVV